MPFLCDGSRTFALSFKCINSNLTENNGSGFPRAFSFLYFDKLTASVLYGENYHENFTIFLAFNWVLYRCRCKYQPLVVFYRRSATEWNVQLKLHFNASIFAAWCAIALLMVFALLSHCTGHETL